MIGTGASAIQFVPGIVDQVGAMTILQRSGPYVVPKPDRAYTRLHQWVYARWPRTQALARRTTFVLSERLNKALVAGTWVTRALGWMFRPTISPRGELVPLTPRAVNHTFSHSLYDWSKGQP